MVPLPAWVAGPSFALQDHTVDTRPFMT